MSLVIAPERLQMALIACADRYAVKARAEELFNRADIVKNFVELRPDDSIKTGQYKGIESLHLNETKAFSPTGLFDSLTSKELYFPITSNAYKDWINTVYDSKNKYVSNLLINDLDYKEEKINKYYNMLDPQGRPATYFHDYQLACFEERGNQSKIYTYNVNNFGNDPNSKIRLNNIEIINQAKDQFTAKIDFKIKMEFNFRSMEDVFNPNLVFNQSSNETFGSDDASKIALVLGKSVDEIKTVPDRGGVNSKILSLKDFFPDDAGQTVEKLGFKIRTYFNVNYYQNLGKLLGKVVSFTTPSSVLFNQKDKFADIQNDYKSKTENYYYIDKIFKIKPLKHNIRFYENTDSNGNAMDMPHKLIIEFGAYLSTTNEDSITIYADLVNDYILKYNQLAEVYENKLKEMRAECLAKILSDNSHLTGDEEEVAKKVADSNREAIENLNKIFEQSTDNLIKTLNTQMMTRIIDSLSIHAVQIPERIFKTYEKNATLHQILEAASVGANVGMMSSMFLPVPGGTVAATTAGAVTAGLYTAIMKKNPDIKDLQWVDLATEIQRAESAGKDSSINTWLITSGSGHETFMQTSLKLENVWLSQQASADIAFGNYWDLAKVVGAKKENSNVESADTIANKEHSKAQLALGSKGSMGDSTVDHDIELLVKKLHDYSDTSTTGNQNTNLQIKYFYFGDLLNYILGIYNKNSRASKNVFVTGNYIFKQVVKGEASLLNLARIPISLSLFVKYLEDNLLKRNSYKYDCITFIRDIINDLIKGAMERAWVGEAVISTEKKKELSKIIPYTTYLSKTRLYGKKESLLTDLDYNTENKSLSYNNIQNLILKSNKILKRSFSNNSIDSFDLIYISCKSDHAYIDFYEDYTESQLKKRGHGYNSLAFMEQVIENFRMPCILLSKTNAIPQIITNNKINLERIDNSDLITANAIAGKNLIENYPYQGTLSLHSMYFNFLDVTNSLFISPGIWDSPDNEYSGLYTILRSTFTKNFNIENSPPEYKIEIRWESNGRAYNLNNSQTSKESKTEIEKSAAACKEQIERYSLKPSDSLPDTKGTGL